MRRPPVRDVMLGMMGLALALTLALGIVTYVKQQNTNASLVALANAHHADSDAQQAAAGKEIADNRALIEKVLGVQNSGLSYRYTSQSELCNLVSLLERLLDGTSIISTPLRIEYRACVVVLAADKVGIK